MVTTGPSIGALASTVVDQHQPGDASLPSSSTTASAAQQGGAELHAKTSGSDGSAVDGKGRSSSSARVIVPGAHPERAHPMNAVGSHVVAPSHLSAAQRNNHGNAFQHQDYTKDHANNSHQHGRGGSSLFAMPDADLHETFGAHAWYLTPPRSSRASTSGLRHAMKSVVSGTGVSNGQHDTDNSQSSSRPANSTSSRSLLPSPTPQTQMKTAVTTTMPSFSPSSSHPKPPAQDKKPTVGVAGELPASTPATAKHYGPTTVVRQHSVTLHDSRSAVPTYEYLKLRRSLQQQQQQQQQQGISGSASSMATTGIASTTAAIPSENNKGPTSMILTSSSQLPATTIAWGSGSTGGYIAEAKRVLTEAMHHATRYESESCNSSYSGAIGPLLKHLRRCYGEEDKTRAALHTLSLLVSNLPNRPIISELNGRRVVAGALRHSNALDVEEQAVQLLWDLDTAAGGDAARVLETEDVFALLRLLGETRDSSIASHALHLLRAALELPLGARVDLTPAEITEIAHKVVDETCLHKHHLQDAAQYTLGSLLAVILIDPGVSALHVSQCLQQLLHALLKCGNALQCQVLLTVMSSLTSKHRLRAALAADHSCELMSKFAQQAADSRLQARALSLVKVLNKEEHGVCGASWYFGE